MIIGLLHQVLNVFAGGRSDAKAYLFLFGFFVLAAVAIAMKNRTEPFLSDKAYIASRNLFLGSLAAAFLMGIGGTIFLYRSLDMTPKQMVFAASDISYSGTIVYHSHSMKPALASIVMLAPADMARSIEQKMDAGVGYLSIFPKFFSGASALLLILVVIGALLTFIGFSSRRKGSWGMNILMLIVTVSAAKNAFDGGILTHEAIPALSVLMLLLWLDTQTIRNVWKVVAFLHVFFAAWVFYAIPAGYIVQSDIVQYILYFIALDLAYFAWLGLATRKIRWYAALPAFLVAIWFAAPLLTLNWQGYAYANSQVADKSYLTTFGQYPKGTLVDSVGDAKVYLLPQSQGLTISDVTNITGDATSYYPIKACKASGTQITYRGIISSATAIHPTKEHSFMALKFTSSQMQGNRYRYSYEFTIDSCLPRSFNLMSEIAQEAGGTDLAFIVLHGPLYFTFTK